MKIAHSASGILLDIDENKAGVIVVENKKFMADLLTELKKQFDGEDGYFVFSDDNKEYNISKKAAIIIDPFSVDCNEKRIQSKLYSEITNYINEDLIEETAYINRKIIEYLEKISILIPYDIDFSLDLDLNRLLKLYDVKIENVYSSLVERLIIYIKALARICGIKCVVFVNIKSFLCDDEISLLYEASFYEKVYTVLFENKFSGSLENEKTLIIDDDLCIIEL